MAAATLPGVLRIGGQVVAVTGPSPAIKDGNNRKRSMGHTLVPPSCEDCEEGEATVRCEECQSSCCYSCDDHLHHSKSVRKSHVRLPLDGSSHPSVASQSPEEGQQEPLDVYGEPLSETHTRSSEETVNGKSSESAKKKRKKKKKGKSTADSNEILEKEADQAKVHYCEENTDTERSEKASNRQSDCSGQAEVGIEESSDPGVSSSIKHMLSKQGCPALRSCLRGSSPKSTHSNLHVHWSPDVKDNSPKAEPVPDSPTLRSYPYIFSNRRRKHQQHKASAQKSQEAKSSAKAEKKRLQRLRKHKEAVRGQTAHAHDTDTSSPPSSSFEPESLSPSPPVHRHLERWAGKHPRKEGWPKQLSPHDEEEDHGSLGSDDSDKNAESDTAFFGTEMSDEESQKEVEQERDGKKGRWLGKLPASGDQEDGSGADSSSKQEEQQVLVEGGASPVARPAKENAGDVAESAEGAEESIEIAKVTAESPVESAESARLPPLEARKGDLARALCELEGAVRLCRQRQKKAANPTEAAGALEAEGQAWLRLAELQCTAGDSEGAIRSHLAAIRLFQALDLPAAVGEALVALGRVQVHRGEAARAQGLFERAFQLLEKDVRVANVGTKNCSNRRKEGNDWVQVPPLESDEQSDGSDHQTSTSKQDEEPKIATLEPKPTEPTADPSRRTVDPKASSQAKPRDPKAEAKARLPSKSSTAVAAERLAGAVAVAKGDLEDGQRLLLGALVGARRTQNKAEEARCLRLLADVQTGSDGRLKALERAANALKEAGLGVEEAEARFRLGSGQVAAHLNDRSAWEKAVRGGEGKENTGLVQAALQNLTVAKGLLGQKVACQPGTEDVSRGVLSPNKTNIVQNKGLSGPSKAPSVKLASETKNGQVQSVATSGLPTDELLGSVVEAMGRAYILLGRVEEGKKHLKQALKNDEWKGQNATHAKQTEALLGRLP